MGVDRGVGVGRETVGGGDTGAEGGLHCGGTEILVGRNASLRMVNLQNWNRGVWHFARQRAVVDAGGRLQWTLAALGSRLSQVQQDVALVVVTHAPEVAAVFPRRLRLEAFNRAAVHHG